MLKVSTKGYAKMLRTHYETKIPLMVMGAPGIGKSQIAVQEMKSIAASKNRKFASWSELNPAMKEDVRKNPSKWFIFLDLRLSQMDTSDLKGIIRLNAEYTTYAPHEWMAVFRQPESDGCILFDEINQAAPIVQASCFQIILDREISDIKLSDNVFMCAAGNRQTDRAAVFQMPFPLRDRFSEIELFVTDTEWVEYAMIKKVSPHIISFIQFSPDELNLVTKDSSDKGATPRGWFRFNTLLVHTGLSVGDDAAVYDLAAASIGEGAASKFLAYCKVANKIDIEMLVKEPERVKALTSKDQKYAVAGILSEHISRCTDNDKERIGKLIEISHYLPADFSAVSLNLIKSAIGIDTFRRYLKYYPKCREYLSSIAKYFDMG